MKKYNIIFSGRAWKTVTVTAESLEKAKELAWKHVNDHPWPTERINEVELYDYEKVDD